MKKICIIFMALLLVSAFAFAQSTNDAAFAGRKKMAISGIDNIRDIGGYTTANGKTIKKGLLYRADALGKATPDGLKQLGKLNIGYIFDLRQDDEIQKTPDPKIKSVTWLHTEIPTSAQIPDKPRTAEAIKAFYSNPDTLDYWKKGYEYMLVSSKSRQSLKTILDTALKNDGKKALLWHCSGGKDRTGFVSAVFLSLLGVDDATIVREYLLTNEDRRAFDDKELRDMDANYFNGDKKMIAGFLSIQQAREEYVSIFLSGMRRLYGTVDNYVILELGITQAEIDKLRAAYTE